MHPISQTKAPITWHVSANIPKAAHNHRFSSFPDYGESRHFLSPRCAAWPQLPRPVLRRVTAILVRRDTSLCRTIEQHHHVRILLDGATLAQLAQLRPPVDMPLCQTIQLAQQHHRHIQLLSQHLRFPSGLCHLLLTVTVTLPRRHIAKLQIINKNHVTLPPGFSATARLSAHDPYSPPYCHPRVSASAKVLQPPHVPPTSPARWVLLSANVAG